MTPPLPAPATVRKILCVCTGNSCRSVMAQGLLQSLLKDHPGIQVMSAGLGTFGGLGATPETVEVMRQEGVDVSRHVARPVTPDLVRSADLILVMERYHLDVIQRRFPESQAKTFLLREFQAPPLAPAAGQRAVVPPPSAGAAGQRAVVPPPSAGAAPLADPDIPDPIGQPLGVYQTCLLAIKASILRVVEWLRSV